MSCPEDDVTRLQLHTPKLLEQGHPRRADDLGNRRRASNSVSRKAAHGVCGKISCGKPWREMVGQFVF